jgi:hypothetical protein
MAKYEIDLSGDFEKEIIELVKDFQELGIKTSVPDLIVKLARGLRVSEIKEYEIENKIG